MDKNFWLNKWDKNEIGFHGDKANALLTTHFKELGIEKGKRVFLPLCGKTRDIAWLLSMGYQVVGAELAEIAIVQLFDELEVKPQITKAGNLKHYHAEGIDIFVGDIFDISKNLIGKVDAIYDRAALVALPYEVREKYTKHLMNLTDKAPQLLITIDYDQKEMEGPPFAINDMEVKKHYDKNYKLKLIASAEIAGGLKGKCAAQENVWTASHF